MFDSYRLSRVLYDLHHVCPSHHTSYVYPYAHLHLYILSMKCCKRTCFYIECMLRWYPIEQVHKDTTIDIIWVYKLFLAIESLHHLYHTSHLLLYLLFQDARLPILMAHSSAYVVGFPKPDRKGGILTQEPIDAGKVWQRMTLQGWMLRCWSCELK